MKSSSSSKNLPSVSPASKRRKVEQTSEAKTGTPSGTPSLSSSIDDNSLDNSVANSSESSESKIEKRKCMCYIHSLKDKGSKHESVIMNSFCPIYRQEQLERYMEEKGCKLAPYLTFETDEICVTEKQKQPELSRSVSPVETERSNSSSELMNGARGLFIRTKTEEEQKADAARAADEKMADTNEKDEEKDEDTMTDPGIFAHVPQEAVMWDGLPIVRLIEQKVKESVDEKILDDCGWGPQHNLLV